MTDRTELTPEKLAELRRLAENATPGAWEAIIFDSGHSKFEFEASVCTQDVGDSICRMDGLLRTDVNERYRTDGSLDAMFIAAANPAAVLGLLDEVERLTAAVERVRALADRIDRHTEVEPDPAMFRDADTGVWWEVSDAIRAALAEDAQPTEGDNRE